MGSAGVYGSAPVVSFPVPPAAPISQSSKPFYRCWDNNQKKWFYWEKDSSATTWVEPGPHITLIDHETGSVVTVRESVAPAPRASVPSSAVVDSASPRNYGQANVRAYSGPSVAAVAATEPVARVTPTTTRVNSTPTRVNQTINPNYSAGVSRYTQQSGANSSQSTVSAAEKARLEEADRVIAEQLQKQLSLEAEAELFASCPLPGEAAKMLTDKKKVVKSTTGADAGKTDDTKLIADMAQSGFVVKKQKQKKGKPSH